MAKQIVKTAGEGGFDFVGFKGGFERMVECQSELTGATYYITPAGGVRLGRDRYLLEGDMLTLELPSKLGDRVRIRDRGECALKYEINPGKVNVLLIQTISGANPKATQQILGEPPGRILMRGFLAKLAPMLDAMPETEVELDPYRRTRKENPVLYNALRKQFCKVTPEGRWIVDANKKHVKKALGNSNNWLHYRTQI